MDQLKDWGSANCKRNPMQITFIKPSYFNEKQPLTGPLHTRRAPRSLKPLEYFTFNIKAKIYSNFMGCFASLTRESYDEKNSQCAKNQIKTSTFPKAKSAEFSHDFFILFANFPFPETPSL